MVGNTAYITGLSAKGPRKGAIFFFAVRDNGEGTNDPPDMITLQLPGAAILGDLHPRRRVDPRNARLHWPNRPLMPVRSGEIQVRG